MILLETGLCFGIANSTKVSKKVGNQQSRGKVLFEPFVVPLYGCSRRVYVENDLLLVYSLVFPK